jgi:hypothetical protein
VNVPETIISGDSLLWKESLADYPSSSWTLRFELRGTSSITITASQDGTTDDYSISVAPSVTTEYVPGEYVLVAVVSKGTDRFTLLSRHITILLDITEGSDGLDSSTHVRRTLEQIEEAIETITKNPYAEIVIAGRTHRNFPMSDLLKMRSRYRFYLKREIAAENLSMGKPAGGKIHTRFLRPS